MDIDVDQISLFVGLVFAPVLCKVLPFLCRHWVGDEWDGSDGLTQGERDAQAFLIAWGEIGSDDEDV